MQWDSSVFLPYDSESRRKQRKWIESAFNDKAALQSYEPIRQRETYKLLHSLMNEPEGFAMHVKRFVAALLTEVTYGHTIKSLDDPYLLLMDRATRGTSEGGAAAALVDFFPVLRFIPSWMPGAGFKRHALKVREIIHQATSLPYHDVKDKVLAGTARTSLVASLLQEARRNGTLAQDERDIMAAASTINGAGSDTTKSVLASFVLAMVVYPEVLEKAQNEVDRVVGVDRLPQIEDRGKLPYIECIITEALRWSSPVPLGIPHCLTEDDNYRGYIIPRGSTVLGNIWAMTHDEETYSDPSIFRPERFLNMKAEVMETADPRAAVFGFGRRICPGRYFADTNIFMAVTSIVATLNIAKARDSTGKEIVPSIEFCSGLTRHPPEFVCSITPRSQRAMDMVSKMLMSLSD
ncbi:cytochrome P450 [Rhodofomes roseus]|uniref:Cytochrome P450 n=1 Tax=Rhodofomes roseus TaxID=34475 RepID=A0ABQ8KAV4_9APHY|nr:cytochrome P450 [Rhodofomes roseus]KAH9834630.1 cytochrome P450 [Rhodofomes roseus]